MNKDTTILTASLFIIGIFGAGIYFKEHNYDSSIQHGRMFEKEWQLDFKSVCQFSHY